MDVLTLNAWQIAPIITKDSRARLDGLTEFLHYSKYDVVFLQEIWLQRFVRIIRNRLPHYHLISQPGRFMNPTGLVTLTKIEPQSNDTSFFDITKQHNIVERIARKGYQVIHLPETKLSFFNAHLYAHSEDVGRNIAVGQAEILLQQARSNGGSLVAGDMNLGPQALEEIGYPMDRSEEATVPSVDPDGIYQNYGGNALLDVPADPRIDHVIAIGSNYRVKQLGIVSIEPLSDHSPVAAYIEC